MPGWDSIFSKEWSGLEHICLEWGYDRARRILRVGGASGKSTKVCRRSSEADGITMTELEGDTICGRRGGRQFVDTLRPNIDGECPAKTVPCSRKTSPENTICV